MDDVINWQELTPRQKRQERFKKWLNPPGIKFNSHEAEAQYKARVTRFINAINVQEGDRVPCALPAGYFPAYYAGYDLKTVMYDYDKMGNAWRKFMEDFGDMDSFSGPGQILPAPALAIIDHKLHKWPGHGIGSDGTMYQFVEGEYIKADEYDELIKDPTDFWLRTFMSRQAGAFAPLAELPHLTPFVGIPITYLSAFSNPRIQSALKAMMNAGDEIAKWGKVVGEVSVSAMKAGYPLLMGGFSGAPFDALADMCRGTTGIVMDMFRQPDKIIEAAERITPIIIDDAVNASERMISPVVMMPLHKGDKTFMSQAQFDRFYWPTFKKVLLGLINEGLVPCPFAEGNYIPRLETIADMPPASMIWYFEYMDMAQAKKTVGRTNCIMGNLPMSIMAKGTPAEVKEGCRKLIETCGPGGGYILTSSASMDNGDITNLRAMMDAAREYGVY